VGVDGRIIEVDERRWIVVADDFGEEVRTTLAVRRLSLRGASIKTGLAHTTIMKMTRGKIPSRATLYDWATALGEPVNKWLALAGYAPIAEPPSEPTPQPDPRESNSGSRNLDTPPTIPEAITTAIILAPTREERVRIAWDWLWFHGREIGAGPFGAADGGGRTVEGRIAIIRLVEKQLNIRLLPPDVV